MKPLQHIIIVDASRSMQSREVKFMEYVKAYIQDIKSSTNEKVYVGIYSLQRVLHKEHSIRNVRKASQKKLDNLKLLIKFDSKHDPNYSSFAQSIEAIKNEQNNQYIYDNEHITIITDLELEPDENIYNIVRIDEWTGEEPSEANEAPSSHEPTQTNSPEEASATNLSSTRQKLFSQVLSWFLLSIILLPIPTFIIGLWNNETVDSLTKKFNPVKAELQQNPEIQALKNKYEKQGLSIDVNIYPKMDGYFYKIIRIVYTLQTKGYIIPYYPDGAYNIHKDITGITQKFAEIAKNQINNDLKSYYDHQTLLKIYIKGVTDSTKIDTIYTKKTKKRDTLRYENEIGTINHSFEVNGKQKLLLMKPRQQIRRNWELACLRAYFIGDYLQKETPIIAQNKHNITYQAETNEGKTTTSYDRRTEITLESISPNTLWTWLLWLWDSSCCLLVVWGSVFIFAKYNRAPITIFKIQL